MEWRVLIACSELTLWKKAIRSPGVSSAYSWRGKDELGDVMEWWAPLTSMLRQAAIFFHVYFRRLSSRNDAELREQNVSTASRSTHPHSATGLLT